MPSRQTRRAPEPVRTVKVSGEVANMEDQPDTARGITLCVLTLVQHTPGIIDVPEFWVMIEDRTLIEGLGKGDRVCVSGELGRRRGWDIPVLGHDVVRFAEGVPMEVLNETEVVGRRIDTTPRKLDKGSLYDLKLDMGDGSNVIVKVYEYLFPKLDETEDGQTLGIQGELKTRIEHRNERVTQVVATSIAVVS